MLFLIITSIFYRITGKAAYYTPYIFIHDFGFYEGGSFVATIMNNITHFTVGNETRLKFLALTYSQYKDFLENWDNDIYKCDYRDTSLKHEIDFSQIPGDTFNFTVFNKAVYYTVILNCDYYMSNYFNDKYFVDVLFLNPNNEHLDYRDIPKLTIYQVFIGLFALILLVFIVLLIYRKRQFLKILAFIVFCCAFYILFLVFSFFGLNYARTHDEKSIWDICLTVFECLYCIFLFAFLLLVTRGWCIINIELKWNKILFDFLSVAVFFSMIFLQNNIELGLWEIIFFILEIVSMCFMVKALFDNSYYANKHIVAHLFVIRQTGIDPSTTPIQEKLKMYSNFLYSEIGILSVLVLSNLILEFVNADNWLFTMFNVAIQFFIMLISMIIFRPRGEVIDHYMKFDDDEDGERDEVRLDDLDGFSSNNCGGTQWHSGMNLPLQPILVGEEVSNRPMFRGKNETNYTSIEEPLNKNDNI